MTPAQAVDKLLEMARERGATSPVLADSSDGEIVIADLDSNKNYRVRLVLSR